MELTKDIKKQIKEILESRLYSSTGMRRLNGSFLSITKIEIIDKSINEIFLATGEFKYGVQDEDENRKYKEKFYQMPVKYSDIKKSK